MNLVARRTAELGAMMMIGDGLLAALTPQGHVRLWERGPEAWRNLLEPFEARPQLTRLLGLAEIGLGIWLARAMIGGPAEQAEAAA